MSRLPDFLVVGQPRTGTTWLDAVLRGHVGLPREVKEVDFFVKNYARGIDWYRRYFIDCDPKLPCGEICPSYFGSLDALHRVASDLPNCRIVCTFRDPVQVLFSFWKLARRNAWTDRDFGSYQPPPQWQTPADLLTLWRRTFGVDRVLALVYDDLMATPQAFLDRICDFIEINHIELNRDAVIGEKINSFGRAPRSHYLARKGRKLRDRLQGAERFRSIELLGKLGFWRLCFDGGETFPALDWSVEQRLRQRLLPQIEDLEQALGRDLSGWKLSATNPDRQPEPPRTV